MRRIFSVWNLVNERSEAHAIAVGVREVIVHDRQNLNMNLEQIND